MFHVKLLIQLKKSPGHLYNVSGETLIIMKIENTVSRETNDEILLYPILLVKE